MGTEYKPLIEPEYLKEAYYALGASYWDAITGGNYYTAHYKVETMRRLVAAMKPSEPFKAAALEEIEEKQQRVDRAIEETEAND